MITIKTRRALYYASLSLVCIGRGYAAELNTDFLRNISGVPSVLKSGIEFPSGEYYVDVLVNGAKIRRMPLTITQEEETAGLLCLSPEWLRTAGVTFKPESYQDTFDSVRGCYSLAAESHTKTDFDYGTQSLDFIIPQAYLLNKHDAALWDYGINGFRLTYDGNFNKNTDDSLYAYGSFNTSLNIGRWVLTSNMNATRNSYENRFQTNDITLSTAISEIQGDLLLGRSQTQTELFNDFGFYGAALRSNARMRSWQSNGYAPVITGVATGTSRITIVQNGYTVYSKVVPPGPYRLDDISPTGNGNLVMTVEDDAGRKTVTEYPVATLPSLLRPGESNYNVALGQKSISSDVKDAFSSGLGIFLLGSYDYGFSWLTVNMATILNNRYQAAGTGVTVPMGDLGAFSSNVNVAKASYDNQLRKQGSSVAFKYAKSFTDRTDLQLLTYRYQTQGYTEYADFRPDEEYSYAREKARYEARLSHSFDNMYLSASYWQQIYWDQPGKTTGFNMSTSTTVAGASVFLSGNHTRNAWGGRSDYQMSLGVSIPFNIGKDSYYNSNSVGYSRSGGTMFNTGVSASVNERFNYNLNANTGSRGDTGASASASYAFDAIQTNLQVSQSRDRTSVAGSVSGSAIITGKTGLLLSKQAADTVAVVKIKDTPGVTFNGSLPTNKDGETVVYMSGYNPSSISINMDNVPDSTELVNTSFNVLPTERAIIYREFEAKHVLRYILRLKDAQGHPLNGGSARTEQKLDAGFVTNNGVLLMNMLSAPERVTVTKGDGQQCSFQMNNVKPNTGVVQEIRCE
ncbi:outer membrane usher protein PefC [Salmonella enterica]|nr:outer membrane usher protein PefC [Salmonella enterica]EEU6243852.1 PefC/AfrB family outer membrane usher protein [Salmonella enterica]EFW6052994.1 PefC/AfrB family outer membrane usher protein [Salmonella enterica]EGH5015783.1 PefC/AfrB family outer membrane usher protein [Salmonella enterica]EHM5449649.1 PefC/AfrB family outer membrane usher protein [Salmonella enterica]